MSASCHPHEDLSSWKAKAVFIEGRKEEMKEGRERERETRTGKTNSLAILIANSLLSIAAVNTQERLSMDGLF